ncbi:MAG: hypothetical protein SF172_05825 [Burkholderiales bacterium]|nr:hypothetical protein [Burkholderiales bacterium]
MSLRIFALWICLGLAALCAPPVSAQSGQSGQSGQAITITVTPEVAEPGVVRTIRTSGRWPVFCTAPGSMTVAPLPFTASTAGLTLVTTAIFFSPCPLLGVEVSLSTTFTPTAPGVQLLTLTHLGQVFAQGQLITRPANAARAGTDITGAWHDPAMPGHGFSLYHSQRGSDVMAGAWYAYDSAGKPHWMLLNNMRWTDQTRFIGELFNITAATGNCTLLAGCARQQVASNQVGRINGEVLGDGRLRLAITAGPPFADPPFPETLVLERLRL